MGTHGTRIGIRLGKGALVRTTGLTRGKWAGLAPRLSLNAVPVLCRPLASFPGGTTQVSSSWFFSGLSGTFHAPFFGCFPARLIRLGRGCGIRVELLLHSAIWDPPYLRALCLHARFSRVCISLHVPSVTHAKLAASPVMYVPACPRSAAAHGTKGQI